MGPIVLEDVLVSLVKGEDWLLLWEQDRQSGGCRRGRLPLGLIRAICVIDNPTAPSPSSGSLAAAGRLVLASLRAT